MSVWGGATLLYCSLADGHRLVETIQSNCCFAYLGRKSVFNFDTVLELRNVMSIYGSELKVW